MTQAIQRPVNAERSNRVNGRRSQVRLRVGVVTAIAVLFFVGFVGTSWYVSTQLLQVTPDEASYNIHSVLRNRDTLEMTRASGTDRAGAYALQWPGGRITLGPIVSENQHTVVRKFTGNVHGLPGVPMHFDALMYTSPAALHLKYRAVKIVGPLGFLPAWYMPGRRTTWVVLVHGRGMDRREGLRPLTTLVRLGLPVLDLSYRNDVGSPSSPDHFYHMGASEWQDLQAGVRFARAHGARNIILFGYSMGGSIVESYLHRGSDARLVTATVLDAPALDWNAVLDFRAAQSNVPGPVIALAARLAAWRIGLSGLDSVNEVHTASDLRVPTLIFQGTSDTSVPAAPNAALARARPDLVTYVLAPGAEHTQAWNANPALYTARLTAFLRRFLR
ncbi:MAG: alpha/beta hydrolase [Chloroflexota bacterium]